MKQKFILGNDNGIHSFNCLYTSINEGTRFPAFAVPERRSSKGLYQNGRYEFKLVLKDGGGTYDTLDHQGHIVPQNIIKFFLSNIVEEMFDKFVANKNTFNILSLIETSIFFKKIQVSDINLVNISEYVHNCLMGVGLEYYSMNNHTPAEQGNLIDIEKCNEAKNIYNGGIYGKSKALEIFAQALDGFLSVIIWNPLNICRAPDDKKRLYPPINGIDMEVVSYLLANKDKVGLSDDMLGAFAKIAENFSINIGGTSYEKTPDPSHFTVNQRSAVLKYLNQCSRSIKRITKEPNGLYQFPWKVVDEGETAGKLYL